MSVQYLYFMDYVTQSWKTTCPISHYGADSGALRSSSIFPILAKAAAQTTINGAAKTEIDTNPPNDASSAEPDDSLLYAIVVSIFYAFVMVFLILANLHPSKSLLADLERYESPTDVNLNRRLPFDISTLINSDFQDYLTSSEKRLWLQMQNNFFREVNGMNGRSPSHSYQQNRERDTEAPPAFTPPSHGNLFPV